jgi:hypothetical protein
MNSQRINPYTLPSRSKSQPHEPKLVKEYVFANATNRLKIKHIPPTMAKKHRGFGGKLEYRTSIENRQTKILITKKEN